MIWILGVCLIAATVIVACEEVNVTEDIKKDGQKALGPVATGAVATKWWEVDKQIEWIAKGLAYVANDINGFRKLVHNECVLDNYNEIEISEAHTKSDQNLSYDLQNGHEAFIDANLSPHTYDKLFFAGFEKGNNDFYNLIWIPEIDSIDSNKQHIFCPFKVKEQNNDITTAYFLDSTSNIDSLTIDWEQDPWKDYYIWVIEYDMNHQNLGPIKVTRNENSSGPCNDGYCDLSQIDEYPCEIQDCDYTLNPNNKPVYQIKLISMQVIQDDKRYIEPWLSGKYEFEWVGCVYNDQNEVLGAKGYTNDYFNCPGGQDPDAPITSVKVPMKDVCKINNNNKERGTCPGTEIQIDELIVEDFRDGDKLMLLCYERDYQDGFNVSDINLTYFANGAPLVFKLLTSNYRNTKATNPFYEQTYLQHPFTYTVNWNGTTQQCAAILEYDAYERQRDEITLNSFGNQVGSRIIIDNNYGNNTTFLYTLELQLKQN